MKGTATVIFWQRNGLKVYKVNDSLAPVIEKEIESKEAEVIGEGLKYLNGQGVYVLLADPISYLYEKIIDPPLMVGSGFRDKLKELVKADIPEDFDEYNWDFKIEKTTEGKQKVMIFAPIKEFELLITEVARGVGVKIIAMESESIAASRDPNPVVGITKKNDINGKDEEVLNLTVDPVIKKRKLMTDLVGIVLIVVVTLILLVMVLKFGIRKQTNPKPVSAPTAVVATMKPTMEIKEAIKEWVDLKIMVQNGTNKSGLAGKTAVIFTEDGVKQVETGNADRDDYEMNKLIFKNESLKNKYLEKINKLVKVEDKNIVVDTSIQYDVIFILGIN